MKRTLAATGLFAALSLYPAPTWADGAFFQQYVGTGQAASLAQTRQEALLAFYDSWPVAEDCSGAIPLGSGVLYTGTTTGSSDSGLNDCGVSPNFGDVWYRYTPAADGELSIELYTSADDGSPADKALSVYNGCSGAAEDLIACSNTPTFGTAYHYEVTRNVTADTEYFIRVADQVGSDELFGLQLSGPDAAGQQSDGDPVPYTTYVMRSLYEGDPAAFAWVLPVPATPTRVLAHDDASLFEALNEGSRPSFSILSMAGRTGGCGCSAGDGALLDGGSLVEVEASGRAGIFEWAALTSTGSDALVTWLTDNQFNIPDEADEVLDRYIQQNRHFLALRVGEPDEVQGDGQIELPPIQFTCRTSEQYYPMAISQISAADRTEVLIYTISLLQMEGANVPNGVISHGALSYDPDSPSLTNYEALFEEQIDALGPGALITECALPTSYFYPELEWPQAPAVLPVSHLTRLRTVMSRDQMDMDFQFQPAAETTSIHPEFRIFVEEQTSAAAIAWPPTAVVLLWGLVRVIRRRSNAAST